MRIAVGDAIPEVTVHIMGESGPETKSSKDLLAGRKVVLFALPGAFTPTCSAKHLPGFIDAASQFFEKGVDEIICLSVNDAWVMDAWGKAQGAGGKVTMVADGNGDLSRALGFVADMSGSGFGERSIRYAMVAEDGVVTHLNVVSRRHPCLLYTSPSPRD